MNKLFICLPGATVPFSVYERQRLESLRNQSGAGAKGKNLSDWTDVQADLNRYSLQML